jgi:hypothetical protein
LACGDSGETGLGADEEVGWDAVGRREGRPDGRGQTVGWADGKGGNGDIARPPAGGGGMCGGCLTGWGEWRTGMGRCVNGKDARDSRGGSVNK